MSSRTNKIQTYLQSYLERRSMPRSLEGKPKAQQDEISALLDCLMKYAPKGDLNDWWIKLERRLGEEAQTRAWPTEGEIKKAAQFVRGPKKITIAQGNEIDAVALVARRMNAGESVSDRQLFGRFAHKLEQSGLVSLETIQQYRDNWACSLFELYEEEKVHRMIDKAKKRHSDAKIFDTVSRPCAVYNIPTPKRMTVYNWDG